MSQLSVPTASPVKSGSPATSLNHVTEVTPVSSEATPLTDIVSAEVGYSPSDTGSIMVTAGVSASRMMVTLAVAGLSSPSAVTTTRFSPASTGTAAAVQVPSSCIVTAPANSLPLTSSLIEEADSDSPARSMVAKPVTAGLSSGWVILTEILVVGFVPFSHSFQLLTPSPSKSPSRVTSSISSIPSPASASTIRCSHQSGRSSSS